MAGYLVRTPEGVGLRDDMIVVGEGEERDGEQSSEGW